MSNVPKLRFKEFSGEWEETILKNISTFYNGRAYKQAELLNSGKYPVLRVGNFFTNDSWYYSDLELDENKYCDNGDLLYAWSASFGPRIWKGEKVIYHYHIWKVENHDDITKKYLYILLDNETAKMKAQSANGFALLHITKGTIENWKVNIPSKQEQEKIASFLTSVDTKIEQLTKKEELLKQYKKGVMQQIFSGEIRFKADDGSEFEDWGEKKLEQVLTEPKKVAVENPNEIELLTVQLHCKGVKRSGNFPTVTRNGRPYYKRNKDELLIGRQNFHNGGIGIVNDETNGYICSNAITSLVAKKDNIQFLYLYLSRTDYYKKIDDLIGGTGQKEISKTELNKLEILVPCIEEQTKIANFLLSIDSKIELAQKQLNSTKEFKKALLQQMFV